MSSFFARGVCASRLLPIPLLACAFSASPAIAVLLQDQNSSITVNPTAQAVISSWNVDGVEHLHEMSNWYRIGSGGFERSTASLALQSAIPFDSNFDGFDDSMTVLYRHAQFDLQVDFNVVGFALGSKLSGMGEQIRITNTTNLTANPVPLAFHFFEYTDLDLTNTTNDDFASQINAASGKQWDADTTVTASIIDCDEFDISPFSASGTLASLLNGSATTLLNAPGYGNTIGPTDATWTLQWDFVGNIPQRPLIFPGQSATIIKEWIMTPTPGGAVPEPCTALGAVVALATVASNRRRR